MESDQVAGVDRSEIHLNRRLRQVVALFAQGLSIGHIAQKLDISNRSARRYLCDAAFRLKFLDTNGLVEYASQHNLEASLDELPKQIGEPPISRRMRQVLSLIVLGCKEAEIAERLGIMRGSVKLYRLQAANRLGVESRRDLILKAVEAGFIPAELAALAAEPLASASSEATAAPIA